ncbi:palmitoyltransferase ZDHHC16-like [Saccoglossus kowalevskii]|uniref:Palmitoyltransferase n=1 Tax=Saccoglossus kowalevskii TaxID=10224 RepID=A0ABM0GXQ8_SACKO|nr:PREDICTED: probable palmitoyltransferase ZDHHC16-like [Saccoglossus kowalevskii]
MGSLCNFIRQFTDVTFLTARSLYFNNFTSSSLCLDTAMQPIFWIVDNVVRRLGPVFVFLVVCLTTSVVLTFYIYIMPFVFSCGLHWVIFHLVFGHWLLMNIIFHYYKAVITSPGVPSKGNLSKIGITSVCKKCISPKPSRTHHCSVCNKCILKMDHHCPWLNNCVGHFNHRYFLQFCVFMWIGTIYVSITSWPLFYEEFFLTPVYPLHTQVTMFEKSYHHMIFYEFFLCSGVVVALGALTLWHIRIITRGETSIESHINRSETKRLKKVGLVYKNPFNFGARENWRLFLGLGEGRVFWRHILLPSSHFPFSDGLQWPTTNHNVVDSVVQDETT